MAETRNMKKRSTSATNTKSTSTREVLNKELESENEPVEVKIEGTKVGTTNQRYAQLLDFAALQNIMTQNVSKTTNKTYTTYTKEKLITYIQSPSANINNLRDVSQYLYRISMNYKKLIDYYSLMPLFNYNVTYITQDWSKTPKIKEFISDYQSLCKRLENIGLKSMCSNILATCLRDGIYTGFIYDDENSFFIQALDPKYIKISGLTEKNTYICKMDMSYFDQGNNKEFLYGINQETEGTWDKIFVQAYEAYKSDSTLRWAELPIERTICIICGDDPLVPLPYFASVFQDLLDLLDYRDLIRSKTELENYVLLLSKIPLLKNSDSVNDFAISLDMVQMCQQTIDSVVPDLAGTAFSPCEVEPIFFNNKNQVEDTNIYAKALTNLFSSVGISEMIFNSDKGGAVGLKHSLQVDMTLPFELMSRIEANIQRYIKLNITENFEFAFHKLTEFNKEDYINEKKDAATLGGSALDYLTALGDSPYIAYNKMLMENAMGIKYMMIPLQTSYVQSGANTKSGAPKKDVDDLSESGQKTAEGDKNGTESN